jgi:Zn-dependent protease with chaperone function
MNTMVELANRMDVKLHPTKSLEIVPGLRNAKSAPCPFFSGHKVRFGGTVQIGCTILCGLTNPALKSVLAHELAHLRRRHLKKSLLSLIVFVPVLVYGFLSGSMPPIISIFLTLTVWALVFSLISWRNEYEADAVGAEYVGKKPMADALEEIARLLHRTRDTVTHPSFKKRRSRLLSDMEST